METTLTQKDIELLKALGATETRNQEGKRCWEIPFTTSDGVARVAVAMDYAVLSFIKERFSKSAIRKAKDSITCKT